MATFDHWAGQLLANGLGVRVECLSCDVSHGWSPEDAETIAARVERGKPRRLVRPSLRRVRARRKVVDVSSAPIHGEAL